MSAQNDIYVIFLDGEYFGTATSEEEAWRGVDDNVDRGRGDATAQYERFAVHAFCNCGQSTRPSWVG